jgi:hypothetical protein
MQLLKLANTDLFCSHGLTQFLWEGRDVMAWFIVMDAEEYGPHDLVNNAEKMAVDAISLYFKTQKKEGS